MLTALGLSAAGRARLSPDYRSAAVDQSYFFLAFQLLEGFDPWSSDLILVGSSPVISAQNLFAPYFCLVKCSVLYRLCLFPPVYLPGSQIVVIGFVSESLVSLA